MATIDTTSWPEIQRYLEKSVPGLVADMPEGKVRLGLSAYGLDVKPQQIMAAGLSIKKTIRTAGRSARLVPNQAPALNSAQVLHNQLTGPTGCELVLVRGGNRVVCARTIAEQDIASYTLRDRGRPKRDARVGMLPPKLAQIIINLAGGKVQSQEKITLLDPFCGTGVVLQEALLNGYNTYGTDLEPRMIEYATANLSWLTDTYRLKTTNYKLTPGDATTFRWQQPVDLVASETYLGQPFSAFPSREKLEQVRGTCNAIIEKFLANIRAQIEPGTRLCLAVPAWQQRPGHFVRLPVLDHLGKLGYNRVSFEHVRTQELIYSREDQIVARELLVITRI
jgi:tRNA G10  N-methylase Trm11